MAEFFKEVIEGIENGTRPYNPSTDMIQMSQRVSMLGKVEFNQFITYLFEYLIGWEDRRCFKALNVVTDLLEVVNHLAPKEVKADICKALKALPYWHVQLFVCVELFGEPQGLDIAQKSEWSLPLELYLLSKKEGKPTPALIERIYQIRDDLTFKFCAEALNKVFEVKDITNYEDSKAKISQMIQDTVTKHPSCVNRLKRDLEQQLTTRAAQ